MHWFAALILGLASLAYAPNASACSCMKLTPSEGRTSSYAVFTGEVTDIAKNEATRFGGLEVTLRVHKMWKGDPHKELKVHTAGSSAACGYSFVKGTTYLVYAIKDEADPLRVSLCSRTAPIDQAKEDLSFLGKPRHTLEGGGRCSVSRGASDADRFGLLLLVAGVMLGMRRWT